jgi:hypothetical protein
MPWSARERGWMVLPHSNIVPRRDTPWADVSRKDYGRACPVETQRELDVIDALDIEYAGDAFYAT